VEEIIYFGKSFLFWVLSDVVAIYAVHVHGLVMGFEGSKLGFVSMKKFH
jgi:hypothetical protein